MKLSLWSLGLYSTASVIGILSSHQTTASAQCVAADVAVQTATVLELLHDRLIKAFLLTRR